MYDFLPFSGDFPIISGQPCGVFRLVKAAGDCPSAGAFPDMVNPTKPDKTRQFCMKAEIKGDKGGMTRVIFRGYGS
jgi:hypothetical protein